MSTLKAEATSEGEVTDAEGQVIKISSEYKHFNVFCACCTHTVIVHFLLILVAIY
jgi:hypothetical protein